MQRTIPVTALFQISEYLQNEYFSWNITICQLLIVGCYISSKQNLQPGEGSLTKTRKENRKQHWHRCSLYKLWGISPWPMDGRVDDGAPWIEYVDLYNPIVSFQVNFLPWKTNMVFTLWGCFSFGCMRRSWNIFSSSCDSRNHQLTRTDWNDNIVGNNL